MFCGELGALETNSGTLQLRPVRHEGGVEPSTHVVHTCPPGFAKTPLPLLPVQYITNSPLGARTTVGSCAHMGHTTLSTT
jgi:hypothetical protein